MPRTSLTPGSDRSADRTSAPPRRLVQALALAGLPAWPTRADDKAPVLRLDTLGVRIAEDEAASRTCSAL